METSLHRQLKVLYAGEAARLEVRLAGYRIDAVVDGELIEIQHGPLGAIRDKIKRLLKRHRVRVVKPIVARKVLVKQNRLGGRIVARRASPRRGELLDLFDELVYFTRVFPHQRLVIDLPLVSVEEWRYPGHGRRRRRRDRDHQVEDQKLVEILSVTSIATIEDLLALVARPGVEPFHTADLAAALGGPRFRAQRVAYCLRAMGAIAAVGKHRNAILYEWVEANRRAA